MKTVVFLVIFYKFEFIFLVVTAAFYCAEIYVSIIFLLGDKCQLSAPLYQFKPTIRVRQGIGRRPLVSLLIFHTGKLTTVIFRSHNDGETFRESNLVKKAPFHPLI